ncbi:hypothetical protein LJK88_22930 [Paenibacillus sp. P26]|nr:hypothetical protein LJK88_22930 [Paenibacillus sp. P26]
MRPFVPMSPILTDRLPAGKDWGYQLKWDGFRILAWVDGGRVELWSKNKSPKNDKYPELVEALARLDGTYLLDGEAVIMDPQTGKPSFQRMQQRDKLNDERLIARVARQRPVQYVIFDLLQEGERDLRSLAFRDRHERLWALASDWGETFQLTDLFEDGDALWRWVTKNGWEGVVGKRLSSSYKEGKEHRDWYKRKTVLRLEAEAVGIIRKEGRVSSMIMRRDGRYFGRVSSGLNEEIKSRLLRLRRKGVLEDYFSILPEGLHQADIEWFDSPLALRISGRELTESGLVRHPKPLSIEGMETYERKRG